MREERVEVHDGGGRKQGVSDHVFVTVTRSGLCIHMRSQPGHILTLALPHHVLQLELQRPFRRRYWRRRRTRSFVS